jgi:phage shock protein A
MALMARISRLFRGFMGLFVSGLEERNPEALMEAARQEFRNKMAQYNMALAQMAGVAERLKNQIKNKTARALDLERRILANHQAGNLELAGTLARELQELKADLSLDTAELNETETAYQANLRQAKVSQREFEDKINQLQKKLSQVKIKEAQAEAAAALSNVAFKVGDLGDSMKTVEEVLSETVRAIRRQGARCCRPGGHGQGSGKGVGTQGSGAGGTGGVPRQSGNSVPCNSGDARSRKRNRTNAAGQLRLEHRRSEEWQKNRRDSRGQGSWFHCC